MKCLKCDNEAVAGNYCSDHLPGLGTMNRAERKGDERKIETKRQNDD